MFKLRMSNVGDINFVYSTWLRSYKHDSPLTKYTKRELFFDQHQKILDRLLSKEGMRVSIACDPDDEMIIYGYLVYEPNVIHYIYVKDAFRRRGIATTLLNQLQSLDTFEASHLTYSLLDLWTAGKIKCEYNAYLLGMI